MTTQSASSPRTPNTTNSPFLKRAGKAAYRLLIVMTENAYRSHHAQLAPYYGTV